MNIRFKHHSRIALGLLFSFMALASTVRAEPYLAVRTDQPCAACHVNPSGGGLRTSYGSYYGAQELPATPGGADMFNGGQLNDYIRLGTDLRFNYSQVDYDSEDNDGTGFNTQSGQLYIALQPKGSRITLYLDQQLLPGGSRNREAYIMARLGKNHSLKAGNLILPYGLRLEDDTAFVRQVSGINFNNSDQGVELGLNFDRLHIDLAVSNGSNSQGNDDQRFQYVSRGEYRGRNWRTGVSYVLNDAEAGRRDMMSLFGGFNLSGFIVLFEVSRIEDKSVTNLPGISQVQEVSLVELNRELAKGYNLKLTSEWLDPDTAIDENERTRHSLLLEYTPYASVQIRGGLRVGDDIPQRETGNYTQGFVQLHWYY